MAGAFAVRASRAAIPDSFIALQFENQANPQFHHDTTGRRSGSRWRQGRCLCRVGSAERSPAWRAFQEKNPAVVNVAVETQDRFCRWHTGKHRGGIGVSFIRRLFTATSATGSSRSATRMLRMVKRLASEEGWWLVEFRSGSFAAVELARELVLASASPSLSRLRERYLSKKISRRV